jgi:peptidoglycan/LPS O-acetylase OafA/YrhL
MSLPRLSRNVPAVPSQNSLPVGPHPVVASLTGLRWIAAAVVFLYHLRNLQFFDGEFQQFLSTVFGGGSAAVSLFFVLSGFVLAWSHRANESVWATWGRRLVRIWPLHLIGVLAAVLVGLMLYPPIRTVDPDAALANVFLVSSWRSEWWQVGNPVSWSLVCEAFFYLVFPLLFRLLARTRQRALWVIVAVAVALAWAMPAVVSALPGPFSPYSFPPARLPEFVVGVALALLMRRHGFAGARLCAALAVTAVGCVASAANPADPRSYAAFTIIGFGMLLTALARRAHERRPTVLAHPILVRLGHLSFAFYLVHLLCLQAVMGVVGESGSAGLGAPAAILAFAMALVCASLLHYGVERPFVRLFAPIWPKKANE